MAENTVFVYHLGIFFFIQVVIQHTLLLVGAFQIKGTSLFHGEGIVINKNEVLKI